MREHVPGGSLQGLTACAGVLERWEEPWRAAPCPTSPVTAGLSGAPLKRCGA